MVLVMGDRHESIGYRSPAAMGQCHECCGGRAVGGCQSGIRGLLAGCGWSHNARYVNQNGRLPFKVCHSPFVA